MLDASHGGTITSLLSPSSEAGINECINNLRHLDANNGGISIVVGIIVGLLASLVQSLGLTIQRKSHVINKALPEDQQRVEHRRPLWLLGFGIFFASNILGSLVQIASLPVVILAPLGAVSLLWNAFFARLLLGDSFSAWMVIGTILIAGGAVLIAVFGIVPEPTHSLDDLLALFRRPTFVAYFSLLGAFVVIALGITHVMEYSHSRRRIELPPSPRLGPLTRINANEAPVVPNERVPLLNNGRSSSPTPTTSTIVMSTPKPSRLEMFLGMSYASFSGILSGMCLIFAKSGVELLMLTVGGQNQFGRWETWVLLIGLAVFALLQLWYLHKSLVLANPTLVCPLAFCWYNISSIVNSLVYFDQFSLLSTRHILLVVLGMIVLLAGVWVVSVLAAGEAGEDVRVGSWDDEGHGDIFLRHDASIPEPIDEGSRPINLQRVSADIITSAGSPPAPRPPPLSLPTSPRQSRQFRTAVPSPSSTGGHGSRKTQLLSPPLGASGFAIGISAASPGFAVHPRRRVASGFADSVVRAQDAMRRTVSEGDDGTALWDTLDPPPSDDVEPPVLATTSSSHTQARKRWDWIRGLLRR